MSNSFFRTVLFTSLMVNLVGCGGSGSTNTPSNIIIVPIPAVTLSASTPNAAVGGSFTLTWTSAGNNNCVASGSWTGNLSSSGTQSIIPTTAGNNTYTITNGTASSTVSVNVLPQYTAIPDVVFETALIGAGLDDVIDGRISTAKALSITKLAITETGYLPPEFYTSDANGVRTIVPFAAVYGTGISLDSPSITDMTGIESFVNLTHLIFENQKVSTVNFSTLINLKGLSLWQEPITSIDLSKNLKLEALGLTETPLRTVDISMLTELSIICFQQDGDRTVPYTTRRGTNVYGFSSLDLSKNTKLVRLYIMANGLTSLDLTNNKSLQELWANQNKFQSFDFRGFTNLSYVILWGNNLNYLNINGINGGNMPFRLYTDGNPNLSEIHVTNNTVLNALIAARANGHQGIFTNSPPLQPTVFVTP